jgi:photosystem II stability/assembly factor-like uncharacterized protein
MTMKNITRCLSVFSILFLITNNSYAQWVQQTTPTAQILNDIDFLTPDYGIAGGDGGTVLITSDGGQTWFQLITPFTEGINSVHIINTDTFLLGGNSMSGFPKLFITTDAGLNWNVITDSSCFRSPDVSSKTSSRIFALGSALLSSVDLGQNWDTLANYTCNTVNIDRLSAGPGATLNAGGLVSGIATYSAMMLRSENNGLNFYPLDVFSFPNADALTAFHFPYADTGMIFMNQYAGFVPGTQNSLVKVNNFHLVTSPDSAWAFSSTIVNSTLPTYINDGYFMDLQNGFAAGQDGNLYETGDGGLNWLPGFAGTDELHRIAFSYDSSNGHWSAYAVGNNGLIIKKDFISSLPFVENEILKISPNPSQSFITIDGIKSGNEVSYSILNSSGQIVKSGKCENNSIIRIDGLSKGNYYFNFDTNGINRKIQFVKQ